MAEEKYIQSQNTYVDEKGMELAVYSTTGNKATESEFQKVADDYIKGKITKGFTVTPANSPTDVMRGFYESYNQPLQQGAAKLSETLGQAPTQGYGGLGQVARLLSGVPKFAAESVNTPEKLGAAVGSGVAGAATGGMSLAPRMLIGGAGTGAGYLAGQLAGGSTTGQGARTKLEPLVAAVVGAASEGFVGLVKAGLGRSVTQKANEGMAVQLRELLESKYPQLAKQGVDGINALAGTKTGLKELTQIGVRGLRESSTEIAENFVNTVNQTATRTGPQIMKKSTQKELVDLVKQHVMLSHKVLDNLDNPEVQTTTREVMEDTVSKIRGLIIKEYSKPGTVDMVTAAKTKQAIQAYKQGMEALQDGAEVLKLMKRSESQLGFDAGSFQREVFKELQANPEFGGTSNFMQKVQEVAFRGEKPGVDAPMNFGLRLSNVMPKSLQVGPLGRAISGINLGKEIGTRYHGNFPTSLEGTAVSIPALKEYMERK